MNATWYKTHFILPLYMGTLEVVITICIKKFTFNPGSDLRFTNVGFEKS
jgi:hypothetical protein